MSTCDPESDSVEPPTAPHARGLASRMNWLRAGVLGANDGTISASLGRANRLTAALRLVVGGALAMAVTYGVGQLFTLATG